MELLKKSWRRTPKLIRQISVAVVGVLVIIAGIIMLAIPGPGWLTIFLGLAILATEFIWANKLRTWVAKKFKSAFEALRSQQKDKK